MHKLFLKKRDLFAQAFPKSLNRLIIAGNLLPMRKERLDVLLVNRGLTESREKAQLLIRAGQVWSGDVQICKPGHKFDDTIPLRVKELPRFVGRGGEKLDAAFEHFGLVVDGSDCLDTGASTGGFTDCMLQRGAKSVSTLDVGKGQLHWKLRNDPRVIVQEGINARYITKTDIPNEPSFCSVDVSFISLVKVLPAVVAVLADDAELVTLIKPQFEAGRDQVEKGGVVRDRAVHEAVIERVRSFGVEQLALEFVGVIESPLKGPAGNIEYLAYWKKSTAS